MNHTMKKNKSRLIAALSCITLLFFVLLVQIFIIQFIQGPELQKKAIDQWVREVEVAPVRGSITDRNKNELAKTISADTVLLRPGEIKKAANADKVADELSAILAMDRQTVYEKATQDKSEVWLKRQITPEQTAAIKNLNLSGVAFTVDAKRFYPYSDFLTQIMGITSVDGNGLSGLESVYNKYLAGEAGKISTETDKDGRRLPSSGEDIIPAVEGHNVVLTIDYAIQNFLEKSLSDAMTANKAKSASGIVMNPATGEILAMSSKPSYDLNNPPRNDAEAFEKLSRNSLISDSFELGSILKTITLSAALEEKVVSETDTFTCTGSITVGSDVIKCHATTPHGTQTLEKALQNSCNPAFVQMGLRLGKEKMFEYLEKFGLTTKTGINFPSEGSGILSHIKYVRDADLARIAFGQSIAVTPLQFITAYSAVVNGGDLMTPYIMSEITNKSGESVEKTQSTVKTKVISPETSATMRKLLQSVVDTGSGKNAYIPGYRVGGKTGTAQKYLNGAIAEGKHIASFVGVAPADDPRLVCLVMVDEPNVPVTYGSVVAAPVVKSVFEDSLKYLNVAPKFANGEQQVEKVSVPKVTGMTIEEAKTKLYNSGLKYEVIGSGKVDTQFPSPSSTIGKNSTVLLYGTVK